MTASDSRLRIVVLAPFRYPICQPHAGGLESAVWNQVRRLKELGHQVTLCAVEGSDFMDGGPPQLVLPSLHWPDPRVATDTTFPPGHLDQAFAAMERALSWIADHRAEFDLVDNHCLHGIPLSWTGKLGLPMMTNLHTPVLPSMLDAHLAETGSSSRFISVGSHTAGEWERVGITSTVVPNAVDSGLWPLGPGGDGLVWFGRLVAEKAPHLAILAARAAGRPLTLAGNIGDTEYAESQVWPLLGADAKYVGPLPQPDLADLVRHSACALVTPAWPEPFGLVIAEALMVGTPVAAFTLGGIPQVTAGQDGARLVPAGDISALAAAASGLIAETEADRQLRARIRQQAAEAFSLDTRIATLTNLYRDLIRDFSYAGATR